MKIVVGGASNVGRSIVAYLSLGNNDIIVVDENATKLDEIAKEYDIQPVLGSISHPDIQESIGMKNIDMLIAVTESDEINMIACQVAYTLFNVPKKIARVDSQYFLNPLWNTLYNEKNLPIDLVITPDIEIGKYILNMLNLPGCTAVYPFFNNSVNIFAFRLLDMEIPFVKFSLQHINKKLHEYNAKIVLIERGDRRIIPDLENNTYLQRNDLLYIGCETENNMEIMRLFGIDHNPYEKVVIFGANPISYYLASHLEENNDITSCSIIDDNTEKTAKIAEKLNKTIIINGDITSDVILQDINLAAADISIALTDRDKDNLLISMIAAKNKDLQALSLINSKDYNVLALNSRNSVILDRSVITISALLHYLRKTRISDAYSIGRGKGEFWEIRLGSDSHNVGVAVKNLNIPENSSIMLILHNNKIFTEFSKFTLSADDKILLYVAPSDIRRIENIFYL